MSTCTGIDKRIGICYDNYVNVKDIRKRLGLTSEGLARELGVSVTTVSRWETGRHKPSKLALQRIKEVQVRLEHRLT
jgi:DNA-binding transcriptional regulator YiaG